MINKLFLFFKKIKKPNYPICRIRTSKLRIVYLLGNNISYIYLLYKRYWPSFWHQPHQHPNHSHEKWLYQHLVFLLGFPYLEEDWAPIQLRNTVARRFGESIRCNASLITHPDSFELGRNWQLWIPNVTRFVNRSIIVLFRIIYAVVSTTVTSYRYHSV